MLVKKLSLVVALNCCMANVSYAVSQDVKSDVETIEVKQRAYLLRSDLDGLISSTLIEKDQLDLLQSSSLGETLKTIPGVHANYFGPSASSPIIRGLDGPRIKMMQNGLDSGDASRLSPDHQVSSETSSASQIEVLRGPATLLHGSGAIGGVVNVIDQRIPRQLAQETSGGLMTSYNGGDKEKATSAHVSTAINNIGLYADAFVRDAENTSIPNDFMVEEIENSQAKAYGYTFGTSYFGDDMRLGASFGLVKSQYGLIGHAHHEDEHHEDEHHEDEHHEDEHHEDEHHEDEHHDDALPFVDTVQKRVGLEANWYNLGNDINEISFKFAYTDYQLQEIEQDHIATQIDNQSNEAKLQVHHQWLSGWDGIVGIHWQKSDLTPVGEEVSSAPATTEASALYFTQSKKTDTIEWHVGARIEDVRITPDLPYDNAENSVDFTPVSGSLGLIWQPNNQHSLLVNVNHSQRALSAAELFSFGEHLGTSTFDVGAYFSMASLGGAALYQPMAEFNALHTEDSNTIDFGWQYNGDKVTFASSVYYSKVKNFAYQSFVDLSGEGLPIYQYLQEDVSIRGGEFQLNYYATDNLFFKTFVDVTEIKLSNGDYLPRIPPMRIGGELNYDLNSWQMSLNASHYAKQDKVAVNEHETAGYTLVGLTVAKQQEVAVGQLKYYLKVNNVLDEYAQVHSSFIKDDAPLAGVSAKLGISLAF